MTFDTHFENELRVMPVLWTSKLFRDTRCYKHVAPTALSNAPTITGMTLQTTYF